MSTKNSGGVGFFGLLGLVFITLKLCGVINWSWWFVLLPLYGPVALFLVFALVCLILAVIAHIIDYGIRGRK